MARRTHPTLPILPKQAILSEEDLDMFDGNVEEAVRHKRNEAINQYKETGHYPEDWDVGIYIMSDRAGRTLKYETAEAYLEKGYDFFKEAYRRAKEEGIPYLPSYARLALWMGFPSQYQMTAHARRTIQFRSAHSTLMTLLQIPLEDALGLTGQNTTGVLFRLKNIPEGWEETEASDAPLRFPWKDRKQNEVVGADGSALLVPQKDRAPEDTYQEMMQQGRRLQQDQPTPCTQDSGEDLAPVSGSTPHE